MSISQKVMILVIVPLFFELAFIFALSSLQSQAEKELFRESHASAVIAKASNIPKLFFDAATILATYDLTRHDEFLEQFNERMDRIPRELRTLELLLMQDSGKKELFARVEGPSNDLINILTQYRNQIKENCKGGVITASSTMKVRIQLMISELIGSIHSLTYSERKV